MDEDFQLIVANALSANASDQGMTPGLLDQLEDTLGAGPQCVLAEAGYRTHFAACRRGRAVAVSRRR